MNTTQRLAGWPIALTILAGLAFAGPALGEARCPTQGELQALDKERQPLGLCPLEHTDVATDISGFVARVTLTQGFGNPFPDPIEAVYTFPMSDRAAVDRMTMTVGGRVVKGVIKERGEARRIYEQARAAGQAASLLDQERPNIFTQSVANILPGHHIEVTISYVEYLKFEDGEYEFSFPMVVGPRYIPGQSTGHGTTQVPDAGRISPPITPEGTRAGHDVSLAVTIDAGVPIKKIASVLHEVEVDQPERRQAVVRLKDRKTIPNRDFVLTYRVAGKKIEDAFLTHQDDKGGFFSLVLYPPERVAPEEARPKEMIFVIDCSGSMGGFPIETAKKTMRLCIENMNPRDTFNLISFAGGTGYCFDKPVANTEKNRSHALSYLSQLEGGGGTEMMGAVRAALGGPYADDRLRILCFMTDGYIGNDMAILGEIQKTRRTARVFSFGIGNSVNRFLIEGMAREGRGASEVVSLNSDGDKTAQRFHERIHSPVLTDIEVDFGGLDVSKVYPRAETLPDLFSVQPLVLTGRYGDAGSGAITVRGKTAAGPFKRTLDVTLPEHEKKHDVLAPLWARKAIGHLMAQNWEGMQNGHPNADVEKKVTRLGLKFSLVTQFTSFVAVEEKIINEGGQVRRVEVPVEMPDGVSYEGIFGPSGGPTPALAAGVRGKSMNMAYAQSAPSSAAAGRPTSPARKPARYFAVHEEVSDALAEPELAAPPKETKKDLRKKLDPALYGLAAKLVNGAYRSGNVEVVNGEIKVYIRLHEITDDLVATLRGKVVDVLAVAQSNKTVFARVRVEDLEELAALPFVVKITPPGV